MKPALFIDRDGTLNIDCPYCNSGKNTIMYDDIFMSLKELSKKYYIIIVTNQSGVGKGIITMDQLEEVNNKVKTMIERKGGRVDVIYYCPHTQEDECKCRKPKTYMLDLAFRDFDIDKEDSFVIGDDDKDMIMARNAGIKGIKIRRKGKENGDYFAEDFYIILDIINRLRY